MRSARRGHEKPCPHPAGPSSRGQAILDLVGHTVAYSGEFAELLRGLGLVFPRGPLAEPCGLGTQIGDILHGQPPLWLRTIRGA